MRNLRLYNTDAAFKTHEQTAGGDGNETVTVVPGVSMSKDIRKRYFNPHDNSILYYNVTIKCLKHGTENQYVGTKTKKIRVVNGTTTDIYINSPKIDGWKAEEPYGILSYPQDTAITISYTTTQKITLIYNITSTTQDTKIYNNLTGWSISEGAYFNSYLSSVTINKEEMDISTFLSKNGYHRFGKTGICEIVIYLKEGISWLPTAAFSGIASLVSIDIDCLMPGGGNGYFVFPGRCFYDCTNLSSITYNNWVSHISIGADIGSSLSSGNRGYTFWNCNRLERITNDNNEAYIAGDGNFGNCYVLKEFTLADNREVPSDTFYNCNSLVTVRGKLPRDLVTNSNYTRQFYGCSSLESVEMPAPYTFRYREATNSGNQVILGPEQTSTEFQGFIRVGQSAFAGCSKLNMKVTITPYPLFESGEGSRITGWTSNQIGVSAFSGCTNMTGFGFQIMSAITTGTTSWDSAHQAWRFNPVYVSNAALTLNSSCFRGTGLRTFSVPVTTNLQNIPEYCFAGSTQLTGVTLPSSVTKLNNYVFSGCTSLGQITSNRSSSPTVYQYTFYGIKSNGTLRYPSGGSYTAWLSSSNYYLGSYGWTGQTF